MGELQPQDIRAFLRGERLYGDDFNDNELRSWFEDERDAYGSLGSRDRARYVYCYHSLNWYHGFRHLPRGQVFPKVLSVGGAWGDELLPIIDRIGSAVILEACQDFRISDIKGVPVRFVEAHYSGQLPFDDEEFSLITCLGTLHHVANVSKVLREMYRCLVPGGYALIREPIVSMGDWTKPRQGLTKRERGIPIKLFRAMVSQAGFVVLREAKCVFSLTSLIGRLFGFAVYNAPWIVAVDAAICRSYVFDVPYHAKSVLDKVRPTSVFYVLARH